MGTSVITIRVTGNHGCQRDVKDGGITMPTCGMCDMASPGTNCIDALAKEFVERLKSRGAHIEEAFLMHWPQGGPRIVDDLVNGRRSGNF